MLHKTGLGLDICNYAKSDSSVIPWWSQKLLSVKLFLLQKPETQLASASKPTIKNPNDGMKTTREGIQVIAQVVTIYIL